MPQLKSDAFAHEREQYLAKLLPELFEGRLVPFNERPMVLNAIQRSTTTQMMSSGKSAPSRNRSIRGSSATSLSTNNPRQMLQGAQPFTDISDKSTLPEAAQITDISPGHSNAEKGKTKSRPPLHVPKWTTAHDKNDGHPLNLLELKVAQGVVGMKLNVLGKISTNLKKLNVEEETRLVNEKAVMRVKMGETLGQWVKEERQKRKGKASTHRYSLLN